MDTAETDNPLLEVRTDVPFDRVAPEHVAPAVDALIARARARLEAIAAHPGPRTFDNTMRALDDATHELEYAMEVVGHLESVATTAALREAYNAVQPRVSTFYSSIPLDAGLWRALKDYAASDDARGLTGTRRRFVEKTTEYFRRNGADLDADGKRRLEQIAAELSAATTRFSQNVLDSTNAWEMVITDPARLAGLPESAVAGARESARAKGVEGYRFTLQAPSYLALLTYLDDGAVREKVWRAYHSSATRPPHDNRPLLAEILRLRREQANLLGYKDFADFVLADRMAHDGARARAFVHDLEARTRPHFARETAELHAFRRELEGSDAPPLGPWDVAYYSEKQRRARYDFDEEALRPYFRAESVLAGMFETAKRLYDVRVVPRPEASVWHPDVRPYALEDGDGRTLGLFYVDLHPRESKRDGAWMTPLLASLPGEGPHVALFCANVTPPTPDRPALLTHREVETLFHEFGHLLHHCVSEVEVRGLAATRVAWDFVELPSQIMENWCWEREALDLFARHYETNAPVPEDLFQKMRRARTYRAGSAMMRQLGFAAVDLALHCDYDPARDGDVVAYARRAMQPFYPTELPPEFAMVAAFNHLFASPTGYAAAYYSYKWAEVLDADAFTRFRSEGVFSSEAGRAFRRTILARGNSADPAELYRAFMGRDARVEALLERSGLVEFPVA